MSTTTRLERISQLAIMAESYPDKPHSTPEDWALLMAEVHEIEDGLKVDEGAGGEMVYASIISRIATTHPEVLASALTTTRDYFTERGYL